MEKEIYILLTNTGTLLARSIQLCTGEQFCHVSIAFDSELREVYSFGRKDQANPWIGGFVQEDVRGPLFQNSPCRIYKLKIDEQAFLSIREQISGFMQDEEKYRYNFLGIFAVWFGVPWQRNNHYFCSQFVNSVLQNANVNIINKQPTLTKPADFMEARLELVYQGSIHAYIGTLYRTRRRKQFRTA
ncbi:hypothetical protein ACFP56_13440 [Paenibacillus septentrionalis]|uniref:Uncharacterized protein n=1 Tax=Paenibacillus septentrionalis TaxID=429342 RepID=A0ABW1V885_9BACL